MTPPDEELTPARLREWQHLVDAYERATAEIERRSAAAVAGFQQHYGKTTNAPGT